MGVHDFLKGYFFNACYNIFERYDTPLFTKVQVTELRPDIDSGRLHGKSVHRRWSNTSRSYCKEC